MKTRRIIYFVLLVLTAACGNEKPENTELKTLHHVERMVDTGYSDLSIFQLQSTWNTEEGNSLQLGELQGQVLVVVMIYTSCKAACPRLVADMLNIERQIPKNVFSPVQYVLLSIDPQTDTPERLKKFAIENDMDGEQWTFLQGSTESVQEFANVLSVKYKQIAPVDFSHSNIISVFNPKGELVHQQEGLGVDNKETVEMIVKSAKEEI